MPKAFARALLAFFDAHQRDLPWRRRKGAYYTLVSELMLQQTVVATVIPYFHRFVARFPDLRTLAAADEADVLALWSGLGYYSRARNLHRTARAVVERHGGELPADEAALRALPGVGPYTAAAIAAIAYGIHTFPLDGNGARVFARIFAERGAIDRTGLKEALAAAALPLVPKDRPGDFAQAVMDLGATVCRPAAPDCGGCPVAPHCQARRLGIEAELPVRLVKAKRRLVELACVAIEREGRVLLRRRAPGELLAGTFTLPAVEGDGTAVRGLVTGLGLRLVGEPERIGAIRHVFTHRDVTATVYRVATRGELPPSAEQGWIGEADLGSLAISSFARKTLALLNTTVATSAAAPSVRVASKPRRQRSARMVSPVIT